MTDREFLMWLHERLEGEYGEAPNGDTLLLDKLRCIIAATPKTQTTPCTLRYKTLNDLRTELSIKEKEPYVGAIPRPPLGLRPRRVVIEARMVEILEAVRRYQDARKDIPAEWIEESLALVKEWWQPLAKKGEA